MKTVRICHTNDVHSSFEAWASLLDRLENTDHDTYLLLDAGDFADRKRALVTGTMGTGAVRLLEEAGYDAMAIGNNEFFAGLSVLNKMMEGKLPLLSANLKYLDGGDIPGVRSYIIVNRQGIRFLILGLSPFRERETEDTTFTDRIGIRLNEPEEIVRNILRETEGKRDAVIILSHMGMRYDRELAEEIAGIAVIIGGHSHTVTDTIEFVNGTAIVQAGKNGQLLGELTLHFDDTNHPVRITEVFYTGTKPPEHLLHVIEEEEERGEEKLSEILYTLDHPLSFDPYEECEAMNVLCDCMKDLTIRKSSEI